MKQQTLFGEMVDLAPKRKVHTCVFTRQDELLRTALHLYNNGEGIHLDPMASKLCFYKNLPLPELLFDAFPQKNGVRQGDARNLPLDDSTIRSVILDPPFQVGRSKSGVMRDRFTKISTLEELKELYRDIVFEAYRILEPKGLLIFKCQDSVVSGHRRPMAHWATNYAEAAGFAYEDELLLVNLRSMPNDHRWKNGQQHPKSIACKFLILRKGYLTIKEQQERARKAAGK